jgi:CRP-like cAMP-binding protein
VDAHFRRRLLRFGQAQQSLLAQTAACNARHELEHRLARWLLMVRDRIKDDRVPMTQEFMALMLGVRRPGVTVAIGALENAGLIDTAMGTLTLFIARGSKAVPVSAMRPSGIDTKSCLISSR